MAPFDFYLFQKLKSRHRGTQCDNNEGVIEAVNEYLVESKGQNIIFFSEGYRACMMHMKLKRMKCTTTYKGILFPYTHPQPLGYFEGIRNSSNRDGLSAWP